MDSSLVMEIMQETLVVILKITVPLLGVSMIVGLVIAIFQAATQIHEQTLTFVPKLIAIFLVLMLIGNWILNNITAFAVELFSNFKTFIR